MRKPPPPLVQQWTTTTGKKNEHVVVVERGRRSWVFGWKTKSTRILSIAISPMPVQQTVSAFFVPNSKRDAHNNKIFHKDDSFSSCRT
jgi:hypothetical protein